MKCSKCGGENPSQAKFCISCGQSLAPTGMPVAAAPDVPTKSSPALGIIAGVLVVILLAVVAMWVKGRGVTQASIPNGRQTPVVRAPGLPTGPQADLLKANKNQMPTLNTPQKNPPPQDVVKYLEHLKKVDDARLELQRREVASMLGMMTKAQAANLEQWLKASDPDTQINEADSTAEAKKMTSELNTEWQKLSAFFLSVPAPEPCATLAGQYYDALRGVLTSFQQINQKVADLDVSALYMMKGQTDAVDAKFTKTDTELSSVCTRYGIDKTFSITPDGGMPSVTGLQVPVSP